MISISTQDYSATFDPEMPICGFEESLRNDHLDSSESGGAQELEIDTSQNPMICENDRVSLIGDFRFSPTETSVAQLMEQYLLAWNPETKVFDFSDNIFDVEDFTQLLVKYTKQFKKDDIDDSHFGYIEKFDFDPIQSLKLYTRADLHGDLLTLIGDLRFLEQEGLLDASFKCKPGTHLIFHGDYCDRGSYGTQVLKMLISLRRENPDQVHLICGNHESIIMNAQYEADTRLEQIISNPEASEVLDQFYRTLPLTSYFSVKNEGGREYIQCGHGLFEPTMDPAPLLDNMESGAHLLVSKEREFSYRIQKIAEGNSSLSMAARRLQTLVSIHSMYSWHPLESNCTAYTWGDVTCDDSFVGPIARRRYNLSVQDIRHYLDLSSERHKVKIFFRGHQHLFEHGKLDGRVFVTTLPVGMGSPIYQEWSNQSNRSYIIKLRARIENSTKSAIIGIPGILCGSQRTAEFPLTSPEI